MAECPEIRREACADFTDYASVPIAFLVDRTLEVVDEAGDPKAWRLIERSCAPYRKDYDTHPGSHPTD